jgi:DNA-binding winged helix-turn-helix (wHTH) protein
MMGNKSSVFRFADVEVREREFRLIKAGEALPVEPKAFRVLLFLLHNPQKLITKEELLNAVWNDSNVSENSLARSIALLRRLLGDDIHEPRYIATVATVGYRFVCPIEVSQDPVDQQREVSAPNDQGTSPARSRDKSLPSSLWWAGGVIAGVVAVAAIAFVLWWNLSSTPVIEGASQLTDDGNPKSFNNLISDGSRIYFNELQEGSEVLAQVAATGGQTGKIAATNSALGLAALASDSSSLLVQESGWPYNSLWILPLPAGEPRKLSEILAQSASLSPDGRVIFTKDKTLYLAEKDGSNPRKLFDFPNFVDGPVVSSDGKRIRVNVLRNFFTRTLWEINADGSGAHPLLQGWQDAGDVCCGRWTSDGGHYVFQNRRQGRTDLWTIPEGTRRLGRASSPIRLTNGPLSYEHPFPSADGKHLYVIGIKQRGELVRYDSVSREFVPYLSGISATDVSVSRDGKWVAYMSYPDRSLWRSRSDGSERLQLTYPPVSVIYPRISPDGTKVAFGSVDTNGKDAAFILPLEGGTPKKIASGTLGASWSPDSNSVVMIVTDLPGDTFLGLQTIDLQTGKIYSIPDSAGKGGPLWPTRDMLVAPMWASAGNWFVSFDFQTQKWSELTRISAIHWMPSVDGEYIYLMTPHHSLATGGDGSTVLRVRLSDRKVETMASLKTFRSAAEDEFFGDWLGIAPDGSPLLTRDIGTQEIYDLSVRWH